MRTDRNEFYNEKFDEMLRSVEEKRVKLQIKIIARLIFEIGEELKSLIEKYPFRNDHYFLLDNKEIQDECMFHAMLGIAERGYERQLGNGTKIVISKDIDCVRVDVLMSDMY